MAIGFGNTGVLTYANWAAITNAGAAQGLVQQIGAPGYSRVTADITAIDANNGLLRKKIFSGRLEGKPITAQIFYDPASGGLGSPPLTTNTLTIFYPTNASPFELDCGVTDYDMAELIDDEVMVANCEFMPEGGVAFDDPTEL